MIETIVISSIIAYYAGVVALAVGMQVRNASHEVRSKK